MCRLECKIRLASIFGELSAARKFGRLDSVFYNFQRPNFSAKNAEQIQLY